MQSLDSEEQWNLSIQDTLGPWKLSFLGRLSLCEGLAQVCFCSSTVDTDRGAAAGGVLPEHSTGEQQKRCSPPCRAAQRQSCQQSAWFVWSHIPYRLTFHSSSVFTVIVQSMYSITDEQNGVPFPLRRNELTWPAFLTWSHSSAEPVDLPPSYANQRKMYVLVQL